MQKLKLQFLGAGSVHPASPKSGESAAPAIVRVSYLVKDESGAPIGAPSGFYQGQNYKPSSGERDVLARLAPVVDVLQREAGGEWEAVSIPNVQDATQCQFLIRRLLPFEMKVITDDD